MPIPSDAVPGPSVWRCRGCSGLREHPIAGLSGSVRGTSSNERRNATMKIVQPRQCPWLSRRGGNSADYTCTDVAVYFEVRAASCALAGGVARAGAADSPNAMERLSSGAVDDGSADEG